MNNLMNTGDVKTYLLGLQSRIFSRLEALQQEIALNWGQTLMALG